MDFLNNLVGRRQKKEGQIGGAEEPSFGQTYPGILFIIVFCLIVLAYVLIILLFRKDSKIEQILEGVTKEAKSSTGIFSKLSEALKGFGEKRSG